MFKNKGQSIIEYCVMAMLIIFGTIVMGPYVIRSVNAHFKLWQESIDDSTNDRMTSVPINITPPECKCSGKSYGGCGSSFQRSSARCAPNQRYWYTPCSPPTCGFGSGFAEGCETDESCCDVYNACSINSPLSSCCGVAPIPDPTRPRTTTDPNGLESVPNNTTDYRRSCYFGEEILYNQCDPNLIHCRPRTDGRCNAACVGDLPRTREGETTASFCPGADQNLTQDTPITFIGSDCQQEPNAPIWHYACDYSAPFAGSVNLTHFSPQSSYTLYLTPPQSHRLGLGIRLRVKIKDSMGTEVTLPCRNSSSGRCSDGLFEMPNSSNPSWVINSNDLTALSLTGPYELSYEWVDWMPEDGRSTKESFGVAIALRVGSSLDPITFTCPLTQVSYSMIDAGSPFNACAPTACPNYAANPSAPKCLIRCKPGTVPRIGYNNTISCVCGNSEIAKSEEVVNASAQASRTFTSEILNPPVKFKVEVHTEDLNFDIQFLDASGNTLHRDVCTEAERNYRNNNGSVLNDSCSGNDSDGAIDSYQTSYTANQVIVYVREGGSASSPSMGYSVYAQGAECHCGNRECEPDLGENRTNCPSDCCASPDVYLPPPPKQGRDDRTWHPSYPNQICQAFGYTSGYNSGGGSWDSPEDNGYFYLVNSSTVTYTFNNHTAPISWCSDCGSNHASLYCKAPDRTCSQCPPSGTTPNDTIYVFDDRRGGPIKTHPLVTRPIWSTYPNKGGSVYDNTQETADKICQLIGFARATYRSYLPDDNGYFAHDENGYVAWNDSAKRWERAYMKLGNKYFAYWTGTDEDWKQKSSKWEDMNYWKNIPAGQEQRTYQQILGSIKCSCN